MSTKTRLSQKILFPLVLFLLLLLLVILCRNIRIVIEPLSAPTLADTLTPVPSPPDTPCSSLTNVVVCKIVVFTTAIPELGTTETGRQSVNLGRMERPGRYILRLTNDSPSLSGHWLEWDYLALKAGDSLMWQIGDDETPPDYGAQATDEFCNTAVRPNCPTEFEAMAGKKIDTGDFPKTLNDGSVPGVKIAFTVAQEQTGADLVLSASTLYSSHVPNIKDFRMRVSLEGPF